MSNPTHPSRQQLDELEALMQRMLALPVNQLEDGSEAAAALPALPSMPEWESTPEEPSLLALTQREEKPATEQPEPEELTDVVAVAERVLPALEPPEEFPETPAYETGEKAGSEPVGLPEPVMPVLRTPIIVRPSVEAAPRDMGKESATSLASSPREPSIATSRRRFTAPLPKRKRPATWLRFLWWCNRTFDRHMGRWGATGRWLRGAYGRAFLGLIGLLLLSVAIVLGIIDWIGWTW